MKASIKIGIASAAIVGVVGTSWVALSRRSNSASVSHPPVRVDKNIVEAQKSPKAFIAKNEASKDVKVQTAVTRARMTEGYDLAKKKDFGAARAQFIEASYKHKGTNAMNPEFGTLSEQALYQAITCLDGDGKKEEAKKEYRKFMAEHKLSPLIHACFRRLERINGKNLPQDEALLQSGIEAQEKQIRFETSVCGPKALEKVLPKLGVASKDYKELAKICKTTDQGTTLEGLKKGCESLGLKPIGLELNSVDLCAMKKPFLWLKTDHYLAILEIKDGKALVYDPRYKLETWTPLPKTDDAQFRATVLAFEVPTTDMVTEAGKAKKS